jgi:hypothetical protein
VKALGCDYLQIVELEEMQGIAWFWNTNNKTEEISTSSDKFQIILHTSLLQNRMSRYSTSTYNCVIIVRGPQTLQLRLWFGIILPI